MHKDVLHIYCVQNLFECSVSCRHGFYDILLCDSVQNRRVESLFLSQKTKREISKFKSMSTLRRTRYSIATSFRRSRQMAAGFSNVGGLAHHLSVLREIVMYPLMFSKLYSHFNINAPRGVLFHGPPGVFGSSTSIRT